jgi:mannitol-1-phosphate 5-dehydrogenase
VSAPRCLVIGGGRMAGGYVAPLLHAAGWETIFVCRNRKVLRAINAAGGLWLRVVGEPEDRWVGGVWAVSPGGESLPGLAARADLLATAVGPSSLTEAGRMLAPLLRHRLEETGRPVNVLTFENSRRGSELLALGMIEEEPGLAGEIGKKIGIGGAAVWRAISKREVTPEGVRFDANDEDECYVDAASLVTASPPLDGSVPGPAFVSSFDDRMVEKLWLFNAGHAAAAYVGWHAGCETLDEAMRQPHVREVVAAAVEEAGRAFEFYLGSRPGSEPIPPRLPGEILGLYADPALRDPVVRVGREPRRKLGHDDRLIGPAVAAMAAGFRPVALAEAAAAALGYGEPEDRQAWDLRQEISLLGPEEVLATVSTLDRRDELTRLICERFRDCFRDRIAGRLAP